jgi:hypothetical protein
VHEITWDKAYLLGAINEQTTLSAGCSLVLFRHWFLHQCCEDSNRMCRALSVKCAGKKQQCNMKILCARQECGQLRAKHRAPRARARAPVLVKSEIIVTSPINE